MSVPQVFSQIPGYLDAACQYVDSKSHQAKDWIVAVFDTMQDFIGKSELWIQTGKPFYDRRIKPLDKTDLITITGALILAGLIMKLALKILGKGILPLATGIGAIIISGAVYYSQYRLEKHSNEIAWDHVDNIRRFTNATTLRKHYFGKMAKYRGRLQKPEFEHLKEQLKTLDIEIDKFKQAAGKRQMNDERVSAKALLNFMNTVSNAPAADKTLLTNLEQEIDRISTNTLNLDQLQTHKYALSKLQDPTLRLQIDPLTRQVDKLITASQNPTFDDLKKDFLEYLKALQNQLAAHKLIDPTGQPRNPNLNGTVVVGDGASITTLPASPSVSEDDLEAENDTEETAEVEDDEVDDVVELENEQQTVEEAEEDAEEERVEITIQEEQAEV